MSESYHFPPIVKRLPKHHFGDISDEVLSLVLDGQCCTIYGLPGVGIVYFVRHCAWRIVSEHPDIKLIMLNIGVEEDKLLLLKRELSRLMRRKIFDELSIIEYLEHNKVILVLTKVEDLQSLELFKFVNALRYSSPENFTVLIGGSLNLYTNSNEYLKKGGIIFSPMRRLGMFDLAGVRRIIKFNNEEFKWKVPLMLSKRIHELSGGHAGLIKYISRAVDENGEEILGQVGRLIKVPDVQASLAESAELFTKLGVDDQVTIGLVNQKREFFTPLLEHFSKANHEFEYKGLCTDLSSVEQRLLNALTQNMGKVITKDQISSLLGWEPKDYSEWAIYKVIHRLRNKLKGRYTIVTIRGKGWKILG